LRSETKTKPSYLAVVVVALIVVLFLSGYEYGLVASLQKDNSSLRSQIIEYDESQAPGSPTVVVEAFNSHLSHMDSRNLDATTKDYTPTATMIWFGTTQGLGGTYKGSNEINLTYEAFLGQMTNLTYSIHSENATLFTNQTASLNASLYFAGESHILGRFNGTVSAAYSYTDASGSWLISQEDSNFTSFDVQYSQGI
jgi:hypothetical protein